MRPAILIALLMLAACGSKTSAPPLPSNVAPEPAGAIAYCQEHPEDELCK